MKLFADSQLETRDLGNALEFVLTRNYGFLENFAGPAVIGAFVIYSWEERSTIALLFAALGLIGLFINWLQGRETVLRVSQMEVVARGNLDSWFRSEMTIPANEITSMGWSAGGEDDSGGVYVATGWKRSYILPGASEVQGGAILAAIAKRFPDFPILDRTPASMLFGDQSGITTLGLSPSERNATDSKP